MIDFDEFTKIVEDEIKLLPSYVFEDLNGGVIVDEKAYLHPKRLADDLYIMGTYSTSPVMGKQIKIYYGSFAATMGNSSTKRVQEKVRDTLRHEFLHHMETQAGFFGDGTLIDEDKKSMENYYAMHKQKEDRDEDKGS